MILPVAVRFGIASGESQHISNEERAYMATILCIDDDPRILELHRAVLAGSGYTVLTALDDPTGLALTRTID